MHTSREPELIQALGLAFGIMSLSQIRRWRRLWARRRAGAGAIAPADVPASASSVLPPQRRRR